MHSLTVCLQKDSISSKRNLANDIAMNSCDIFETVQDGSVNPNLFHSTGEVLEREPKRKKINESAEDKNGGTADGINDHIYVDNVHHINSSESESTHVEIHGVSISNNSTSSDEPSAISCVFCCTSQITEVQHILLFFVSIYNYLSSEYGS